MRTIIGTIALCSLLAASCGSAGSNGSSSGTGSTPTPGSSVPAKSGNRVTLHENGLKVSNAVLLKEDGSELPADNTVGIGEKVFCRLTVDGWKVEDGKVLLGTSEKISTASGNVVLNEPDLFATYGPAAAEDAKVVTIRAVITSLQKSLHDFNVEFRIWDKRTNAEVTGSFPFHLR